MPTDTAIAHAEYFELLRELAETGRARGLSNEDVERDPQWRTAVAGLVTLRLIDRWAESRTGAATPLLSEIEAVQQSIIACDAGPIPNILSGIVLAVTRWWARRAPAVLTSLLAYARLLDGDEHRSWQLAEDVYTTFLRHARTPDEFELVPNACVRLGRCQRNRGHLDDAATSFDHAVEAGEAQGDAYNMFLGRIGTATIIRLRGDLPAAEAALDAIIRDAEPMAASQSAYFEPLARAKHERAYVAYERQDYQRAIMHLHAAMRAYTDDRLRDNALHDLALVFVDIGLREAGRDAFLVLRASGASPIQRWSAMINLLRLAVTEGQETVFERYRREIATVKNLPPFLAAHYYLHLGDGYRRFGRPAASRNALARAIHLAEQHRFNHVLMRAEELAATPADAMPAPVHVSSVAPAVSAIAEVAGVMRVLRELATAGEVD